MAAATLPLHEALNESISSGRFEDTKIILYSRKDSSGTICGPRALYASSHVLKSVPYFNDLLFGTFAEAKSKGFSEEIDDSESAEDYGYYSDSDLEEDTDVADSVGSPISPLGGKQSLYLYGKYKERPDKGKVIKIRDVAFITFQAFLFYLYTGDIEFAPYGSEGNRKSRITEMISVSEDSIPRPSPKSIYRLADKYDVPSLKSLAFVSIRDGIERCDIVEEAFSEFASKYQQVMTAQVNYLASEWFHDDRSTAGLGERIDEKVDSYANGELDHIMGALTLLWELSREDESSSPILGDSPRSYPEACPLSPVSFTEAITSRMDNQRRFKTALIKSIRQGVFYDRKYWTRHPTTARALRVTPLYISSIVTGERLSQINDLVKPHQEGECLDIGSGSEDSDCGDDPEQANESAPEKQDGSERETLPVITIGSFTSWRCLFFYLCTDEIQFAPLKSQGAEMRAQYIRDQTTSDKPPPCSPKAIYSIADALDIKPLRDLALDDIRSKVSSTNVVVELFSSFTSRESDVMKMHCELLGDKFRERSVTVATVDLIKGMAGGNAAHRAGALKLALRNGNSRRGAPLYCHIRTCEFHDSPYRSVGSRPTCPQGHWVHDSDGWSSD